MGVCALRSIGRRNPLAGALVWMRNAHAETANPHPLTGRGEVKAKEPVIEPQANGDLRVCFPRYFTDHEAQKDVERNYMSCLHQTADKSDHGNGFWTVYRPTN